MKLRHLFFACSGVFVMMFSLLLLVVIVFSDEEDGGSGGNLISVSYTHLELETSENYLFTDNGIFYYR